MKRGFVALFFVMFTLIAVNAALAGGPNIKPGKWEFKTTIHSPMMPEPRVISDTKCITQEEASGDPLAAMLEESECKILNREESDNTIEFEVECRGDMDVTMKGKGKFTGDGSTASGNMEMSMEMPQMGGKTMTITQEWEARRIGDCE